MANLRCLLVDDEHFALALLEKFVADTPGLEVVATTKSAVRALETLQTNPIDLLFLDVQMPIMSGVNMLKTAANPPVTIFTTAYPQYAVEAFNLDAVDYLLKPFSFDRFSQAVEKARALIRQRQTDAPMRPDGYLTVKADRKWIKIAISDIRYVEGWKEYVKIYTDHDKVVTLESLANLENNLPTGHFLRVHKSFIVARDHVQKMDGDELVLIGEARIPVARARKKEVVAELFGA